MHAARTRARGWAAGAVALALAAAVLAPPTADAVGGSHRPVRAVALGDSYASGEGLGLYRAGTDTATNACHRSTLAYPELLSATRLSRFRPLRSVACSGATTASLLAPQPDTDAPAQLSALTRRTRAVTLTIGGNDIGFVPILRDCIYAPVDLPEVKAVVPGSPGCERRGDTQVTAATAGLAGVGPAAQLPGAVSLPAALDAIHDRAPAARVYVTGYPRLVGTAFDERLGCQVGRLGQVPLLISPGDVRWIRAKVDGLNAAIAASVRQARDAGVRATYVDVADRFDGHEVCGDERPWLNGLVLAPTDPPSPELASFHPNALGHQAIADAVAATVRHGRRG